MSTETKTIGVSYVTWQKLNSIGKKGETFNDVIDNLIKRHFILKQIEEEQQTGDSEAYGDD